MQKYTRVNSFSTSIAERFIDINIQVDAVISEKLNNDNVLLTIFQCKARYTIINIISKTINIVMNIFSRLVRLLGEKFRQVFKIITSDSD